ncbi:MAG: Major facilitator superfamily protein 10 Tetracycline transporter-like protein [Bacteroidota bacterium]|nr:Major facilitator superfamily protein 10 Tetracycline transporter-like protein [Bacteroidota bacterium]
MSPLLAVFITVFIDMLGIGIIIPISPGLILHGDTSILDPTITLHARNIIYGFFCATYPFFQFFGAPILGTLADKHGRKKILQISLVGTFIGYVLFAFAIHYHLIWLLFISRALPGFTGGNISIVLASLADISKPEEKAKNFGMVGMAFGLGFILGPAIGWFLSDSSIVSWFNASTPLCFTALLTVVNMVYVYKQFPETFKPTQTRELTLFAGIHNLKKAIGLVNMRVILLTIFLQAFGWSFFMQFNQVYLIQKFHFSPRQIGILFAYIGVWIAITQGGITRVVSKKFAPPEILKVSLFFLALAIVILLLPEKIYLLYLLNPFVAIFQGLTQPNQTSIVSSLASKDNQGEILGVQQSLQSFAFTVPPILAGFLLNLDYRLPMVVAAVMTVLAWIVFILFFKESAKSPVHVAVE